MNGIPNEVRELIRRRVPTMDHVEVLMRLYEADGRGLSTMDIERESRLDPKTVARVLPDLVEGGLLTHDKAANSYAFTPADDADRRAVDALSIMYNQRPVTLVKLVYSQPPPPVKSFADAFRLRDEPKRGDS